MKKFQPCLWNSKRTDTYIKIFFIVLIYIFPVFLSPLAHPRTSGLAFDLPILHIPHCLDSQKTTRYGDIIPWQLILITMGIISSYIILQTPKMLTFHSPWYYFMVIISSLYIVTLTFLLKKKASTKNVVISSLTLITSRLFKR